MKAHDLLEQARMHMEERARQYDQPGGERSMGRTVAAFNAITEHSLTEAQGWLFMQLLKDVRLFTSPGYHADSAEDGIAYSALMAEAKSNEFTDETAESFCGEKFEEVERSLKMAHPEITTDDWIGGY